MSDLLERISRLETKVAAIERRLETMSGSGGVATIVQDKEYDRVLHEMKVIEDTYAGHQSWSQSDTTRFRILRLRRDELRKQLGIKV